MPVLKNPQWEKFARALALGKSQPTAYAEAGYTAAESNACRLANNDKIKTRVAELLAKAAERADEKYLVTVESLTAELEQARQIAIANVQAAAAATASMGKAKLHGFLVDKVEMKHSYSDLSDAELQNEITMLLAEVQKARATAH